MVAGSRRVCRPLEGARDWPVGRLANVGGRGDTRVMERAKVIRVDGAVFADCLFLIGQAWLKRDAGDLRGAGEDLAAAMALVPDGSVEMIMSLIESGEWPEPSPDPDAMDAWLERCRLAGAGDLRLIVTEHPAIPSAPVPPPRQVEAEADFLNRLSRIRAEAEARQAAARSLPRPSQ